MSAQEDFNLFSEIAKKVCESAEEAAAYIDKHMEKAGHKRTTIWEDSESADDKGGKKAAWWETEPQKQTRDIPRRGGGNSAGWPYGNSA